MAEKSLPQRRSRQNTVTKGPKRARSRKGKKVQPRPTLREFETTFPLLSAERRESILAALYARIFRGSPSTGD